MTKNENSNLKSFSKIFFRKKDTRKKLFLPVTTVPDENRICDFFPKINKKNFLLKFNYFIYYYFIYYIYTILYIY